MVADTVLIFVTEVVAIAIFVSVHIIAIFEAVAAAMVAMVGVGACGTTMVVTGCCGSRGHAYNGKACKPSK